MFASLCSSLSAWWKAVSCYLKQSPRLWACLGYVSKVYNGPFFPRGSWNVTNECVTTWFAQVTEQLQCKTNHHSPLIRIVQGKWSFRSWLSYQGGLKAMQARSRSFALASRTSSNYPLWASTIASHGNVFFSSAVEWHTALWFQILYKVN